jgi:ferritin-like metal-binding protein YciE
VNGPLSPLPVCAPGRGLAYRPAGTEESFISSRGCGPATLGQPYGVMKVQSLEHYYVDELKDLYDAEKQLLRALPRMAKAATHAELRAAFEEHAEQTQEQVRRLEQILQKHEGGKSRDRRCKAMMGLIEEGQDMLKEKPSPNIMDVGLITTAQKAEHYEIAGYGCLNTYAKLLGLKADAALLHQTLTEEKETDLRLSKLAKSVVNPEAKRSDSDSEDERRQPRSKRQMQSRASGSRSSPRANSPGARSSAGGERSRGRGGVRSVSRSRGSGSARSTQDLDEIRKWVEARGGKPAKVCGTGNDKDPGLLRIDFPGYRGEDTLQEIPWDEWYRKFQENNLTFLYQEKAKGGRESRFFKLVCGAKSGGR